MSSTQLIEVIQAGDLPTFQSLIRSLPPSDQRAALQSSAREAIKHNQPGILTACLTAGASTAYWDDSDLVFAAAKYGTPATLAALLDAGGLDVTDEPNEHMGGNFLNFCVSYDNLAALRYLFEARGYGVADVGPIYKGPRTPLFDAVQRGSPELLAYLLDRGADPGRAPGLLHVAACFSRTDAMRVLLDRGAVEVDGVNGDHGMRPSGTALHRAADRRQLEAVRVLLDKGADVSKVDSKGQNVIERSRRDGQEWNDLAIELRQRGLLALFGRE